MSGISIIEKEKRIGETEEEEGGRGGEKRA
jgi:hypothetical protein